jgi:hypothetical protein
MGVGTTIFSVDKAAEGFPVGNHRRMEFLAGRRHIFVYFVCFVVMVLAFACRGELLDHV